MLKLIKSAHSGQSRNAGKVPYWQHCVNVAEILKSTLELEGEKPEEGLFTDMVLAALGHDLLEDTDVTEGELRKQFGNRPAYIIVDLTNYQEDHNTKEYLDKITAASDEAKLIKYCDLLDNTLSVAYGLQDLGAEWATSFYLPIALSTAKVLGRSDLRAYPNSLEYLKNLHTTALALLNLNLENVQEIKKVA